VTQALAIAPRLRAAETRDAAIRAAERVAYRCYGAAPREHQVGVDTGCGRVEVRIAEFGEDYGKPPIVMLHGIGSATVLAASLLCHLKDRRVIAVDWPGYGLSGACTVSPLIGIRSHAVTTLTSLLDRLHIREVDLLGHSLGAQFSIYAAHDLGLRVRRIALLGAPGAAIVGVKPVPIMKALAAPVLGRALLTAPMPEQTFRRNQNLTLGSAALNNAPPALAEALYLLAGRRSNASSIASFFRALISGGSVRRGVALSLDELSSLSQPVLFAWGDQVVFQTPAEAATSIVAIRDVRLLRVPTAGHAPRLQAEATVGGAIAAHLAA
jgi:pimeloyl-ACP methyl ester carboxylesterase